jgi:hypothetical protein
LRQPILQRRQHIRAAQIERHQPIAKRQHFQHIAVRNVPGFDGAANTSAIRDRDLRLVPRRRPQHRIRNQIAGIRFLRSQNPRVPFQVHQRLANHLLFQIVERLGKCRPTVLRSPHLPQSDYPQKSDDQA